MPFPFSRVAPFIAQLLAAPLAAAEAESFVPLFNGHDLAGWVDVNCAPETFTVKDGMIHCDGIPTGALRTVRPDRKSVV